MANYLYQRVEGAKDFGFYKELPAFVREGINPRFDLRPYQESAFCNYITYYETPALKSLTRQVLFHMATGSGKTLIMSGLITYLYKQGYRNFLFFVNRNIIIKKTKENFLNTASPKYQFNPELTIEGVRIPITEVDNFDSSNPDGINICFVSIQKLHGDLFDVRENSVSIDDFKQHKIVMISDEAHHLNAATLSKDDKEDNRQWEVTISKILNANEENLLLEFTATCKFENNPLLLNKYEDKVVFDYSLVKYREDKYSKDIFSMSFSDSTPMDRALIAAVMSQLRLKLFQREGLDIKPVLMLKSKTIVESKTNMAKFCEIVSNITGTDISRILVTYENEWMKQASDYFTDNDISIDSLALEIRQEFGREHCISANEEKDADKNQLLLNSLEEKTNPYRVVFAVDKLNEGWDVLNLFDIVRLSETVGSINDTNAEAQLIGRGARYCPFETKEKKDRYRRKYDDEVNNPMRICETLLYHCINESQYISRLNKSLRESGAIPERAVQRDLFVKDSFKKTDFYKKGLVFVNSRREIGRQHIQSIPDNQKEERIYYMKTGAQGVYDLFAEKIEESGASSNLTYSSFTIKEIADINYGILHRAIRRNTSLTFSTLKQYFPSLQSTREFVMSDSYLGNAIITICSKLKKEEITIDLISKAVWLFFKDIAQYVSQIEIQYEGTKEFTTKKLCNVIRDRVLNFTNPTADGVGISQGDMSVDAAIRLDLRKEDWYVFTDNYGTPEEKAFVAAFKRYYDDLQTAYSEVYLVRNEGEKELATYSFNGGHLFEPDYILFLKRKKSDDRNEQIQIFIEPKGDGYIATDIWKEEFLLDIEKIGIPVITFVDNTDYRIRGFHFFNRNKRREEFKQDMGSLL